MFNTLESVFAYNENLNVPLKQDHINGYEIEDEVPFWRRCPRESWTHDELGRKVFITSKKAWVRVLANSKVVGVTPFIIWEKNEESQFPIMLWKPGLNDNLVIPKGDIDTVIEAAAFDEKFGTQFSPNGQGKMAFESGKHDPCQGVVEISRVTDLIHGDVEILEHWEAIDERLEMTEDSIYNHRKINTV